VTATAVQADAAPRRVLVTACLMMAVIMQTLDTTIANVALPYMQGSMAASQEEISWVLTSYIVAAAIMTAPVGWLAGRFGRRRIFVVSTLCFTTASVLCGMAQSLDQIVFFRVLQGLGGAALVPLSQATLLDTWPPEQRGTAMSIWIMGALVGPVLGPTLGGWLTEHYSWRSVFFINVPFGELATAGLLAFLKNPPRIAPVRLDWIGFAALSLGVGALQTMLDRGETLDWFASREIQIEAVLAGLGFYTFLMQSLLAPKPFISPKLFKDANFTSAIFIMFLLGLTLYATMALLAPYLQVLMNYPVATAGLILAPQGAGAMISALVCGQLIKKVNVRLLVAFGFAFNIYTLYAMTFWTPDVSGWTIGLNVFIQGMGTSFISVPLATIAFMTLKPELRGEGAGIFSLMRNIGSSIGISVTAALLTSNTQINHAIISGAVTPFNHFLQNGRVVDFWNPVSAHGAMALNSVITRQSSIIAYVDNFKLMLILTIIASPLLLLLKGSVKVAVSSAAAE
jgi:DHA2 family multidrug resistance protein